MELTFDALSKNYGKKQALIGFSAELTGGIYGLLGPNGAGKSTLMNILTGNLRQTAGEIRFNGAEIRSLGAVGLSDVRGKTIRSLSGGMKQRLLLAQAILDEPDILILDEPTAGLDPRQRIAVRNLIAEIALQKIVIVSTHVVPDVEYVASELLLLSEGRLLRKASPAELTHELAGQVWEAELAESELPAAQAAGTVCGIARVDAGHIRVRLLAEKQPPFACRPLAPELEDVYLHYFGAEDGL